MLVSFVLDAFISEMHHEREKKTVAEGDYGELHGSGAGPNGNNTTPFAVIDPSAIDSNVDGASLRWPHLGRVCACTRGVEVKARRYACSQTVVWWRTARVHVTCRETCQSAKPLLPSLLRHVRKAKAARSCDVRSKSMSECRLRRAGRKWRASMKGYETSARKAEMLLTLLQRVNSNHLLASQELGEQNGQAHASGSTSQ